MNAIQTYYKGYHFRSRLEARWAVFFDSLDEEWEYEKEGYKLPSRCYLPDFWLPRMQCWLEIKGNKPTKKELKLMEELQMYTGFPAAIAHGLPQPTCCAFLNLSQLLVYCPEMSGSHGGPAWQEVTWALDKNGLCFDTTSYRNRDFFLKEPMVSENKWLRIYSGNSGTTSLSQRHIAAAKSARFEFGEAPLADKKVSR